MSFDQLTVILWFIFLVYCSTQCYLLLTKDHRGSRFFVSLFCTLFASQELIFWTNRVWNAFSLSASSFWMFQISPVSYEFAFYSGLVFVLISRTCQLSSRRKIPRLGSTDRLPLMDSFGPIQQPPLTLSTYHSISPARSAQPPSSVNVDPQFLLERGDLDMISCERSVFISKQMKAENFGCLMACLNLAAGCVAILLSILFSDSMQAIILAITVATWLILLTLFAFYGCKLGLLRKCRVTVALVMCIVLFALTRFGFCKWEVSIFTGRQDYDSSSLSTFFAATLDVIPLWLSTLVPTGQPAICSPGEEIKRAGDEKGPKTGSLTGSYIGSHGCILVNGGDLYNDPNRYDSVDCRQLNPHNGQFAPPFLPTPVAGASQTGFSPSPLVQHLAVAAAWHVH